MRRPLTRPPLIALVLGFVLAAGAAVLPPAAAPLAPAALRPVLLGIGPAAAQAADGLGIQTAARYTVVPDRGVVHVTVDITATNDKAPRNAGGAVTSYYYESLLIGVQAEARNLRATEDGRAISVTSSPRQGARLATIRFRSAIYYGESAKLRLRYDLPTGSPRSASDVRVGAAFASFLAWAFGDSGTVRVDIPASFHVDVSGHAMDRTVSGDTQVFRASTSDPAWYAWINARNDGGLTHTKIDLGNGEVIVIRGWPEDKRWRSRVGTILTDGIPQLTTRIGLPWPVDGPLSVIEIHTPLLEGYAGFYDPKTDEIQVSEDLDDETIVHEASHAWFNQRLFTERWINEGLAETYATAVTKAIGGKVPARHAVTRDKGTFALNDWPGPSPIRDQTAVAREEYGYDAASQVISSIVGAAGEDGMRKVFAAADARTTAYVGSGAPEKTTMETNDWRRFLDLVEQLGGATKATELLRTWALSDAEAAPLDARSAARTKYAALVAAGDGWAAPTVVRMAMDGWRFDEATADIGQANGILATRDSVETLAATAGLDVPASLEAGYEGATDAAALGQAATQAKETEASLRTIDAATAALAAPRDWLVNLGLSGKDPDGDLAAARTAWESGQLAQASDLATLAAATIAVAPDAGRGRALVGGGVVLLLVLLTVVVLLAARRRAVARRRASEALPPPANGGSGAA